MDKIFICEYADCNKFYSDPVSLPCHNNICKSHVDSLIQNIDENNILKCQFCLDDHQIPENGFPSNHRFDDILSKKLHLKDDTKNADDLLDKLKTDFEGFKKSASDPEAFIYEYVSTFRNKIDLKRESLIESINKMSDEAIEKLNSFEIECKQNLNNLKDLQEANTKRIGEIEANISIWKDELRKPMIDAKKLSELLKDINKTIEENEKILSKYTNDILLNKKFHFNGSYEKFGLNQLFGHLEATSNSANNLNSEDKQMELSTYNLNNDDALSDASSDTYEIENDEIENDDDDDDEEEDDDDDDDDDDDEDDDEDDDDDEIDDQDDFYESDQGEFDEDDLIVDNTIDDESADDDASSNDDEFQINFYDDQNDEEFDSTGLDDDDDDDDD